MKDRHEGRGPRGAPRGTGAALVLAALAALSLLAAPSAQAAPPRTIAGWGHGAGKVNGPNSVAVDQATGDLYIADQSNLRIDKFDSEGHFLLAWGAGVADGKGEELQVCGPAVEPEPIKRCFDGLSNFQSDESVVPRAVAVEQSTGDVYVVEAGGVAGPGRVKKFTPSGELISLLGPDVTFSGPGDSGADETQTLTVKATAGTFTLSLRAPAPIGESVATQTTAPISFEATHEEVQEALEALPSVEAGDLTVTGGPGDATGSAPYEVHFSGGGSAGNYVAPMKAGAGALTGSATIVVSVPGGGPEVCEPARGDVCKEASGSGAIPGEFDSPFALAFDSAGKLWILSGSRNFALVEAERLQRFDSDGAFLEEVPLPAGARNSALAIDPTSDDFYVLGPMGHNETQNIGEFIGTSSGAFTLSFEGETTGSFEVDSFPSAEGGEAIQAALEALPAIGEGNVSVESGPFAYQVTFIHDLGGRDISQMTAAGGSPPVTVTQGLQSQGAAGSVEKLDPTGALIETLYDEPGDLPEALATDSAGNLYVGDLGPPYRLLEFNSSGEPLSVFGAGQVIGQPKGNALAFDESSKSLYTASSTEAGTGSLPTPEQIAKVAVQAFSLPAPGPLPEGQHAEDLLPTTATLEATLNPEGHETTYRFEYGTSESYGENTPLKTLPGEGFESEPVEAPIEGLIPDTEYHFRLCATNAKGNVCGEDTTFTTPTAVGIEAQWASEVAARSANLNATLDPRGAPASWWLEYDTSPFDEGEAGHGTRLPVPNGNLSAGEGAVPVSVALTGLEPATTYHYRFVAADEREGAEYVVRGEDRSFATQPAALGFALPDSRAWEMVTPAAKHGALVSPNQGAQGGQVQAAANGEALAYLTLGSIEAAPQGNRLLEQSSALARRGAGGRWTSTDISPPHTEVAPVSLGGGLEYKLFSSDLGQALLQPRDATPLSPWTSERTSYLRDNASPPTYTPLVVGCPAPPQPCPPAVEEHADVPAGTEFGKLPGEAGLLAIVAGNVTVAGASPDLRHVLIGSNVPLTEEGAGLYEWTAGRLQPILIRPAGEAAPLGAASVREAAARNMISEDGSRVFWAGGGLYVRDLARGETARLDVVQPGGFGTGEAEAIFQGASSDGSVAFFTDTQNLTEDANEEGADLYRCEVVVREGHLECDLTDLTAAVANFGESAEVQGLLPGIGAGGKSAYLVARGVLDEEPNGEDEAATPGQPNLYVWREGEGVRFITTLSEQDERDWGVRNSGAASAGSLTAASSPSGRYLAFMSESPLTGYDNRDAKSGERAQEVFLYDSTTGELACASCNPSGARPAALLGGEKESLVEFDPQELWKGRTLAAALPEATNLENEAPSLFRPRAVHDDGRLFFDAADSLVSADSNGNWDVYEYEPTGVGGCSASAGGPGTARTGEACVSLISSGTGEEESAFLDASESGNDVFFYSPARLSVTDTDEVTDVYDARVGGEPAKREEVAECQGEACQPPASAPFSQTPASAAFRGPGNLKEGAPKCKKGKVKKSGKCVKKHKAEKHKKSHRKHKKSKRTASHNRGGGK